MKKPSPDPAGERVVAPKAKPFTMRADAPHLPAPFSVAEHAAVQALAAGAASPEQQQLALDWIIHKACRTYDLSFRWPDDPTGLGMAFAQGRTFAGQQIVRMLNTRLVLETRPATEEPK